MPDSPEPDANDAPSDEDAAGQDGRGGGNRLAVLIDLDNFRNACGRQNQRLDPAKLNKRLRTIGVPIWKTVYVDVGRLSYAERCDWFSHGFQIIDCPKRPSRAAVEPVRLKDQVDQMIIDTMLRLIEALRVDEVVLAAEDSDYVLVVQAALDRGLRVRVVVPTPARRVSELASRASGVMVYHTDDCDRGVLAEVAALFNNGTFVTSDAAARERIHGLGLIAYALANDCEINQHNYGFMRLQNALRCTPRLQSRNFSAEDLRESIQFLQRMGVLVKTSRRGLAGAVSYRVETTHPFVVYVNGSGFICGAAAAKTRSKNPRRDSVEPLSPIRVNASAGRPQDVGKTPEIEPASSSDDGLGRFRRRYGSGSFVEPPDGVKR